MRTTIRSFVAIVLLVASTASAQKITEKSISVIERAMSDEIQRAKGSLKLQGLADPFFISYTITDQYRLDIQASYGSLINSNEDHKRVHSVRLMVGDYQLNDENFQDNSGGFLFSSGPDNSLPLDDDYNGIRRSLWLATDDLYKQANETFTKKKAALENKQLAQDVKDLPDFVRAPVSTVAEPPIALKLDRKRYEMLARDLSKVFEAYPDIQSSKVSFNFTEAYQFIVNTEGTRVRRPVLLCEFKAQGTTQAAQDGEPLALSIAEVSKVAEDLPKADKLRQKVIDLAANLIALRTARRFDDKEYTGPVLFESDAGYQLMTENFIPKLSAKREDIIGGGGVGDIFGGSKNVSLKEKLQTRVLPKSVSIVDRPLHKEHGGLALLGYFASDDEGTAPVQELKLVESGMLKTLYTTRTPSKELREPNGHARSQAGAIAGTGDIAPAPGVIEVTDTKALPVKELRKQLFERAKDNGYSYALIVRQISTGIISSEDMPMNINDLMVGGKFIIPTLLYRVDLKTGKEELVRGAEITLPTARDWREVMTSKEAAAVNVLLPSSSAGMFNFGARIAASYIGPASYLCPELEVHKKKTGANPTQPVVARP